MKLSQLKIYSLMLLSTVAVVMEMLCKTNTLGNNNDGKD